jgi:hypothetical protein
MVNRTDTPAYRLAPRLAVERFGPEAVVLVEDRERFLTVNRAALDLLTIVRRNLPALRLYINPGRRGRGSSESATLRERSTLMAWLFTR